MSCLDSRLRYAGDDYCLLRAEPEPRAYSLYNSAKVDDGSLSRLPHLARMTSNTDRQGDEKALLFLHRHYPEKLLHEFPLTAVLLPRITGRTDTALTPASPVAALTGLAPSTIFQLPRAGREAFELLTRLVRRVPCFYLDVGTDLRQIPETIAALIEGRR